MTTSPEENNPPKLSPNELVDFKGLAAIAGIKISSARAYNSGAKFRRKQAALLGDPSIIKRGDLPAPDKFHGQSPVWRARTIYKWMATRPGQGVYEGPHGRQAKETDA